MRNAHIWGLALVVSLTPGVALAGDGCRDFDVATHVFEVSDADGSGTLTPDEFEAAGLERYGVPFEEYDADADGEASLQEYLDLYESHHKTDGGVEG